jgi:predicted SAM-dependent methyltransferase
MSKKNLSFINFISHERRKKMLRNIDLKRSEGLEIGALCRPFVQKMEGNVIYVDHVDTDTLKKKYRDSDDVDINSIVPVDAVWGENNLYDAVGGRLFDYVIASHVIEHVPDLISWLCELASILKKTGEVRVIIPDKRYTFDYMRQPTRLADVMLSYLKQARVPQPHSILDFALNASKKNPLRTLDELKNVEDQELHYTWQQAMGLALDAEVNRHYHDIHCWAFTPQSFASLMEKITSMGLIDFACEGYCSTAVNDIEFFVRLRRSGNPEYIRESWMYMQESIPDSSCQYREWSSKRQYGVSDSLDPSGIMKKFSTFDAQAYLIANPDVKAAGIDPFLHYLLYGWKEGRVLT